MICPRPEQGGATCRTCLRGTCRRPEANIWNTRTWDTLSYCDRMRMRAGNLTRRSDANEHSCQSRQCCCCCWWWWWWWVWLIMLPSTMTMTMMMRMVVIMWRCVLFFFLCVSHEHSCTHKMALLTCSICITQSESRDVERRVEVRPLLAFWLRTFQAP